MEVDTANKMEELLNENVAQYFYYFVIVPIFLS